jgi:hypothetical protein
MGLAGVLLGLTPSVHAASGNEVMVDDVDPPLVRVAWTGGRETAGLPSPASDLRLTLVNQSGRQVWVDVDLRFSGAGGGVDMRLGVWELAPGGSGEASVDVKDLPIASTDVSTGVRAVLWVSLADGQTVKQLGPSLYFHLTVDRGSVLAYSANTMITEFGGGLLADPFLAKATSRGQDGATQEAVVEEGYAADDHDQVRPDMGVVGASREMRLHEDEVEPVVAAEESEASATAVDVGFMVTMCTRWRYAFPDNGVGEDFMATDTTYVGVPAVLTRATVMSPLGNGWYILHWSGYLNDKGCTPSLVLSGGTYHLNQYSTASDGAVTVNVRDAANAEMYIQNVVTIGGSGTFNFNPSANNDWTAATAAVSDMLHRSPDLGLAPGTIKVEYSTLGCATSPPAWACYNMTTRTARIPVPTQKFLMTHEIGHDAQFQNPGFLLASYSQNAPEEDWQCTCEHVVSSTKAHCLQSREKDDDAIQEGFGYFYAAKVWNNNAGSDCWMAHSKEFRNPHPTFWDNKAAATLLAPPVTRNCLAKPAYKLGSNQPWIEAYCDAPNAGVEHDWMNFFWAWHTGGPDKASMAEIYDVMNRACYGQPGTPPAHSCSGTDIGWANLDSAAQQKWGAGPKYSFFADRSVFYGLPNPVP